MKKLFEKYKNTNVQYGIFTELKAPKSIYPNIIPQQKHSDLKCPAVNSMANRIFSNNSFLSGKIEFHYDENVKALRFRYNFDENYHPANNLMHDFIKDLVILNTDNGKHTIQILTPYLFLTNDKSLEISTLDPNLETENVEYVMGGFKPYGWARQLNLAYALKDNTKVGVIYLDVNSTMMKYIFNKPINLEFVNFNTNQLDFIESCKGAIKYRKNINKIYNNHIKRRPKDILQ